MKKIYFTETETALFDLAQDKARTLMAQLPSWRRGELSAPQEARFLFGLSLVAGGLGNVLAAGIAWEGIDSARYLMFFFFAPLLLVLLLSPRVSDWRSAAVGIPVLAGLSAFVVFTPGSAMDPRRFAQKEAAELIGCAQSLKVHRGLANYWDARRLTFLSKDEMRIDPMPPWPTDRKGLMFYWTNNAFSFLRGHPAIDPFDYLIADSLDPQLLEEVFGVPDEKRACGGREFWVYRDLTHVFARLFQGNLNPYLWVLARDSRVTIPASAFDASVGTRAGLSRKADSATDATGYLVTGGALELHPGDYRFTVKYSFPPTAAPASLGNFDVMTPDSRLLGTEDLVVDPDGSGLVSVDVHVVADHTVLEPRVVFAGAGQLTVEEVSVMKIPAGARALHITASNPHAFSIVGVREGGLLKANGSPGYLLFGPYAKLAAGAYRATLHFAGSGYQGRPGKIDVVADQAHKVLAQSPLSAAELNDADGPAIALEFELSEPVDDLELRVFVEDAPVALIDYEIAPR